ncbi:MAG: SCO family protein [Gemmatimonadales bacterium]|nr:MAG: SCO family protein [Gemmatimonadales bacterium]
MLSSFVNLLPILSEALRPMRRRLLQVLTGLLIGLAMVAGIFFLAPPPGADPGWEASSPPPNPYPAPALELEDLQGETVNLASFRGRAAVVFFGFSNCPDVCPATLLNLSRALDELSNREQDRVQVLFVTVDPERDTPERLDDWMENFHPSIVALRGEREEVWDVARGWGVHAAIVPRADPDSDGHDHHAHGDHADATLTPEVRAAVAPGAPGEYSVDHSARSFVIDRSGRVVALMAPFSDYRAMAHDLRLALR